MLSLPQVAEPFSLLWLSDLHWFGDQDKRYRLLSECIEKEPPDWLLFGGDLYAYLENAAPAWRWLSSLPAKCGKLAVLGNRESVINWLGHEDWRGYYQRYGFRCLINESWDSGGDGPLFFGLDDFRFGKPDWQRCREMKDSKRLVVTLSHNPDAVAEEEEGFVGHLCLSGHTHGGQIRLPLLGAMYTSSIYGAQFVQGWQRRSDQSICHISAGVGESGFGCFRRRYRCPAEFSRIQVSPEKANL